jgi:hypothetical protein
MIRWMFITFLALLLIGWLLPTLRKFGFGKLPGDFNFKIGSREIFIPLGSTIVLSLVFAGLSRLL